MSQKLFSLSWKLMLLVYIGMLPISFLVFQFGDPETMTGRFTWSMSLANLCVIVMGIFITLQAFRFQKKWAWWVNFLIILIYGIPMTVLDFVFAGWMGTLTVFEFSLILLTGLALGFSYKTIFSKK